MVNRPFKLGRSVLRPYKGEVKKTGLNTRRYNGERRPPRKAAAATAAL
jgi:hypothetical protein